ncbi:YjcZ family sporulation protein [Brevibacillus sp. SYSU BS000544]
MSSVFNGCFDDDFILILVLFILLVIVGAEWD